MTTSYIDPKTIIKPASIIELIKNTSKCTKTGYIHLSVLSMKKIIPKQGYAYNTDPKREQHQCNGSKECHLAELEELFDYIVMTLIVENREKPLVFAIKSFEDHSIQNCEVTFQYLQYVCHSFRTKDNKLNNKFVQYSDALYDNYSDLYEHYGYTPQPDDKRTSSSNSSNKVDSELVPGSKKILARSKPVVNGVAFAEVLKSGIQNNSNSQVEEYDDDSFDNIIEEITTLKEERDSYKAELEDSKKQLDLAISKTKSLESVLQEQEALIKKLNADLLLATSKANKLSVIIGSIKSNVSKSK